MFRNILGHASGISHGGDKNTLALVNNAIFEKEDVAVDFKNLFLPSAGAAMVTQPHGGTYPHS